MLLRLTCKTRLHICLLVLLQVLTQQALIGTVIALAGTWLYTDLSSKYKHKKPEAGSGGKPATA